MHRERTGGLKAPEGMVLAAPSIVSGSIPPNIPLSYVKVRKPASLSDTKVPIFLITNGGRWEAALFLALFLLPVFLFGICVPPIQSPIVIGSIPRGYAGYFLVLSTRIYSQAHISVAALVNCCAASNRNV